jgi:hypothetical protein
VCVGVVCRGQRDIANVKRHGEGNRFRVDRYHGASCWRRIALPGTDVTNEEAAEARNASDAERHDQREHAVAQRVGAEHHNESA